MAPKRLHIFKVSLLCSVLLWMAFCMPALCIAMQVNPILVYRSNLYTSLTDTPANRRIEAARYISKASRKMSEADAMRALDDLNNLAVSIHDLPLQCAVFDMRADYYSANRGYNHLSTNYYKKAIDFAEAHNLPVEVGIYQHRIANYFFLYKQNTEACRYYLLSEDNFKSAGFKNVPGIGNMFSETANFYYALGGFDDARDNLNNALKYQPWPSRTRVNIFNTIALTYRNTGQYQSSLTYFNRALKLARQINDSVWVAITIGNIGSVYYLQHNYNKALPLITQDYRQSVKFGQTINSAIALLRLVHMSLEYNKLNQAALQLDTVDRILSVATENVLAQRAEYYSLLADVNGKLRKPQLAERYRLVSEKLNDSVARRDNVAAIERLKLQWVKEKNLEIINSLRRSTSAEAFKQNAVIVVLLLLIIIGGLIYNRQRLKAKKDRELSASEKLRLDEELKNASNALSDYTENLRQKNELIDGFKAELERLQVTANDKEFAANLDKLMRAHIMTDDSWEEFKKLFGKVHGNFLYNLRHTYTSLSDTDVRLLALIKLKLNNREMAGMLGITVDGVKKAKQRLRKKMNIDADDIEDVVNKL